MKTSDREILKGYYWNHNAIRKDVGRLEKIRNNLDSYSENDFERIRHWFDYHKMALVAHHEGEDDFFFPKINERAPDFSIQLEEFDKEHKELDQMMEVLREEFKRLHMESNGDRSGCKDKIDYYKTLVIDHLNKEEKVVEQAITRFEKAEILRAERDYQKQLPREKLAALMPWLVDAMDEKDQKLFFNMLPFFVKWMYKLSIKSKYQKMADSF